MSQQEFLKPKLIKKAIIRTTIGVNKVKCKWSVQFLLVNPTDHSSEIITQITVYYLHTDPQQFVGIQAVKRFKNHYLLVRRLSIQESVFNILTSIIPDQIQCIRRIEEDRKNGFQSHEVNKFEVEDK